MVEEVKGLLAEGYSLDKIKANLIKIGYTNTEVDEVIKTAQGTPIQPVKLPEPTEEVNLEETPSTTEFNFNETSTTEDDLLLASSDTEPIDLPSIKKLPKPPQAPKKPSHGRHHHEKHEEKQKMPEEFKAEDEPSLGGGKAIIIFVITLLVIAALAYFLLFPKLGIELF